MNIQKGRGRGHFRKEFQYPVIGEIKNGAKNSSQSLGQESLSPQFETPRVLASGRGRGQKIYPNITKNDSDMLIKEKDASCFSNSTKSKTNLQLAVRPGYGTVGHPIDLWSNYFKLKMSGTVYHYDIEIISLDQQKKYGKNLKNKQLTAAEAAIAGISRLEHELNRGVGKLKRKEIFDKLIESNDLLEFHPVYDGVKNVFTSKVLPFQKEKIYTINLKTDKNMKTYEVTIKPVKKDNSSNAIHLSELQETRDGEYEIIMALNSIMNHRATKSTQIQIGRSFFYLNQSNKTNLGEGLEIWYGYHQSVHSTERGAVVVLNLAAKAFHKEGPVIDYVNDILKRDATRGEPMKPYELKNISDALKGVRVEVTHLSYPRKYVVEGVSKLPAKDIKLNNDIKGMSIAQYFADKYGPLRFPFLHCLFMRTSNKQTYIPFEHCKVIAGQPKMGKLSPAIGAKMIKQTAIPPDNRFKSIVKSSQDVKAESGEQMKNYSIFMDLQLQPVKGRVLSPPSLVYDKNTAVPNERGIWNMNGKKFFKSLIAIESWIIIDFAEVPKQVLDKFSNLLVSAGHKVGLNFGTLCEVKRCNRKISAEQALREAERTKAAFAVIILSRRDRFHSYDEIKFIADYQLRFINQCIDERVLGRFDNQIATNLCLKINVKLGGVNHILGNKPKILSKPVMIVGADAVHSPRGSRCPSVAAVVGSMDAYLSKYKISCRVQENPDGNKISQELILEMREMITHLLKDFYHNTKGKRPEKIIFFRDGVSEGQFQTVYEYEIRKIQEACQEEIGRIVPITFVIVQKRHQTRFKPQNPNEGVGRGCNIPPGTTVDSGIVHPHRFDYFLNSHEGIQGTSKSAHYTVLHDDNQFSADELQELSYHLCYTYNKCNRSISIPAPVKYADLACYRAKKYADFHLLKEQDSSSSSSDSSVKLPDHAKNAINTMGDYGRNFFFV